MSLPKVYRYMIENYPDTSPAFITSILNGVYRAGYVPQNASVETFFRNLGDVSDNELIQARTIGRKKVLFLRAAINDWGAHSKIMKDLAEWLTLQFEPEGGDTALIDRERDISNDILRQGR